MKYTTFAFAATLFLIFTASPALGAEGAEKLERQAAAQAWQIVSNLPANIPAISGGGLVIEPEANDAGRKVWLYLSSPGVYLTQGRICGDEGNPIRLGEMYWEENPYSPRWVTAVYDGRKLSEALPYFSQICSVEVVRMDGGVIERSSAWVNPLWTPPSNQGWHIGSEGLTPEGQYYVSLGGVVPEGATIILGRFSIGELQVSPFGGLAIFSEDLPPLGLTTLTLCGDGKCETKTFEKKVMARSQNGKG